jgi:peroxiredoxin
MPELDRGVRAPSFEVVDHEGKPFSSKDLRGSRTVLYFFPKADTSG